MHNADPSKENRPIPIMEMGRFNRFKYQTQDYSLTGDNCKSKVLTVFIIISLSLSGILLQV